MEAISINVVSDLKDTSHLKKLLSQNFKPAFAIGAEVAQYANQPVGAAVKSTPAQVTIQGPGEWKTSTGLCFSLNPTAKCTLAISATSGCFSVATDIESTKTKDISAGPIPGKVYINIELDFELSGNISGSGTAGGVGISGKASGSSTTTFSYCYPVAATTETVAAVKEAFSSLIFPFEPDCALLMPDGSLARMNFDGQLAFELDATYGLGSFKFSAPGVNAAQQSKQIGLDKFTLPQADIEAGATASFSYTHCDHFGVIVNKVSGTEATLYLVRSAKNESQESSAVKVGISQVGCLAATMDKVKLAQAVDKATKGTGAGAKVASVADKLQSSLVGKASQWLAGKSTDASLTAALSQQVNRTILYTFKVDLTKADLVRQSWIALAKGDVKQAVQIGGMTLLPGSGVGDELKRTVSISLHFFNLFSVSDTASYFRDSYVEIGPDGSIRFLYDIGTEDEVDIQKAIHKCRFHFVATARAGADNTVQDAAVDLHIEVSETNDPREAAKIVGVLNSLGAAGQDAEKQMTVYASAHQKGTLSLANILQAPAYQRLKCSEYVGAKPPANPQQQDRQNFAAFHKACLASLQWPFLAGLSYSDWAKFNEYCNNPSDVVDSNPNATPDRRNQGDPSAVPDSFFANRQADKLNITYYYQNCGDFMNLCDSLHRLAGLVGQLDTDQTKKEWDALLQMLNRLVKNSLGADFSKPSASALLQLCQAAKLTTKFESTADNSCFTCTVTLS